MRRLVPLLLVPVAVLAALAPAGAQVVGPDIKLRIQDNDARLKLSDRLVFSTVNEEARPARFFRLQNAGDANLTVALSISGPNASEFALAPGTPSTDTLVPGELVNYFVVHNPIGPLANQARLRVDSNDPDRPAFEINLKGIDAVDYEEADEPILANVLTTIGYGSDVGPGATLTAPVLPDEVLVPYFTALTPGGTVRMMPIARYSSISATTCCDAGWYLRGGTVRNRLHVWTGGTDASGGQNQRLMPAPPGAIDFKPTGAFGLYAGGVYTDDAKNGTAQRHAARVLTAMNVADEPIANTYIVVFDQGRDPALASSNSDFQDFVYLLVNAKPA